MNKPNAHDPDEKSGSRIDAVYNALFQAILAQELMPGTKLSEETIGTLFSVSRTIVRAALNRLHTESLVEFRQNRGAFVASTTPEEARQVFEARNAIEREIFHKLASIITDKQIQMLQQHLEDEHKVDGHDHARAILLSGEFHLLAARMSGNEVLAGFLKSLISRTSLILAQHSTHQEPDCSVDEHAEVLDALRARNPQAAANAIVKHLGQVFDRANIGQRKKTERNLSEILSRYA
ncbi:MULTISPECIES: GntR family transcriptional regulator [unclassified Rhizobium]|uniref:GntR family transcriptional regulator n=1 Tax=unclassified Rhizobium TaxID=2613769 RepID=UPI0009E818DD|nr:MULTISPECIES: GntR family transcriptional regulator [unclassified Rhizobium]